MDIIFIDLKNLKIERRFLIMSRGPRRSKEEIKAAKLAKIDADLQKIKEKREKLYAPIKLKEQELNKKEKELLASRERIMKEEDEARTKEVIDLINGSNLSIDELKALISKAENNDEEDYDDQEESEEDEEDVEEEDSESEEMAE